MRPASGQRDLQEALWRIDRDTVNRLIYHIIKGLRAMIKRGTGGIITAPISAAWVIKRRCLSAMVFHARRAPAGDALSAHICRTGQ